MSIYEKHRKTSNDVIVIYEDTKGKTRYKLCKNTTDKENTYNGFNHYIVLIQRFRINGYYSNSTVEKMYYNSSIKKRKFDFLEVVEKLIKLFD